MIKKIKFPISENSDPVTKTINYFTEFGYRQKKISDKKFVFRRGSVFKNLWTSHPLKWKSLVEIDISDRELIVKLNVDSTGQILTKKDKRRWEILIDNLKSYLTEPNFDFKSNKEILLRNRFSDYANWSSLVGFIAGISASFVSDIIGVHWILTILIIISIFIVITKILNDRRTSC